MPPALAVGPGAGAAGATPSPVGGPSSGGPGGTPILSARRLPAALGALAADRALVTDAAAVLAGPGAVAAQSCLVIRNGASPVFALRGPVALLPASNLKVLTAYAVLARLGSGAHLTTTVVAAAKPVAGVVDGPLYLVGGGDPLLSTPGFRASQHAWTESAEPVTSLADLADAVRAAGVSRVMGGVVGDDSRFDTQRELPTWSPSYLATGQIGPVGALVVDRGVPTVTPGGPTRRSPAADPAVSAATAFATLLVERGIVVSSSPSRGLAPARGVTVASVDSPEVGVLVGEMVRESDNLAAEMLTKELGRAAGGGGSWAAGTKVVRDVLAAAGIPLGAAVLVDGSGLDRNDRVSCDTLVAVLAAPGPVSAQVRGLLPLAGNCGTLVGRFAGQSASGRIRAKTGSLAGVDALSGVSSEPVLPAPVCPPAETGVSGRSPQGGAAGSSTQEAAGIGEPADGAPVTFSLILNGITTGGGTGSSPAEGGVVVEDRVADAVARYPAIPPLGPLGPGAGG